MNRFKFLVKPILILTFCLMSLPATAATPTRFDVITLRPQVDNGDYFTVYGSPNLKAWQGSLGFYVDYANRPLEYRQAGTNARQSIVDNLLVGDFFGALGFTDYFEVGINIPVILYNWYFVDTNPTQKDHGAGMGDIFVMAKFRLLNQEDHDWVGMAFMPFITLPSGDFARYMGAGHLTGGATFITDFFPHERFNFAINLGVTLRDKATSTNWVPGLAEVRIHHRANYSLGMNVKFTENFHGIAEIFGSTNLTDFFQFASESPLEAGAGIRYIFDDSGFAWDLGGTAGLVDGVGAPRFRVFTGLRWTSAVSVAPQVTPPPPPDPRIRGNKIIFWGKVYFDTDKSTIKTISHPVLDDVLEVLQRNPHLKLVEVQGHTDPRGGARYNLGLSQRRAEAVKAYLIGKGVAASRLTAKGYGLTRPIADNSTRAGMAQNRRVEFVILEKTEITY